MKKPEPVLPARSLSQLRMWTGRPRVSPGGGGGGQAIGMHCLVYTLLVPSSPAQTCRISIWLLTCLCLCPSASQPRTTVSGEGAESMLIDSPDANASSPSRELLRSPVSSVGGFMPKKQKHKPPNSSDPARLSMYLTAQQHKKLKQHMQQVVACRAAFACLVLPGISICAPPRTFLSLFTRTYISEKSQGRIF